MKNNKVTCPVCNGEGRILIFKPTSKNRCGTQINERCTTCEGKGEIECSTKKKRK